MGRGYRPLASSQCEELMQDHSDSRFPRIAPILLIAVLIGLAISRPGVLAGESALAYRYITTLASVAMVAYIAWRFHGILAVAVIIAVFCIADYTEPNPIAFVERHNDTVFLATLAVGIAAASRQGKGGPLHWIVIAIVCLAVALFGWYGLEAPTATDQVARERMRHVTLGVAILAFLIGFFARSATWLDRLKLFGATVAAPAVGVIALRLVQGEWPAILEGGDWGATLSEWKNAFADGSWSTGSWAWTAAWLVASLMVIGIWRTVMRGLKQWREHRSPLAWLLTAAGISVFVAIGARPLGSGSLALAAIGAILSVFGIADLILALVERIELRPPEPGPSNIPRVK